jgi:Zn-dependent M28 family amino/carboxypeptidase
LVATMSCNGTPPSNAAADAVDASRYRADLEFIAAPRTPGSAHWQATQDRCAEALAAAGLTVTRQSYGSGVNVLGELKGTSAPDDIVLIGAHYDSVAGCAGADDNASSVAAVLEIARALSGRSYSRTLMLACWDQEESGFVGSRAFVGGLAATSRFVGNFNLEMVAFASSTPNSQTIPPGFELLFPTQVTAVQANQSRGDFIALVADSGSARAAALFTAQAARVGLPHQRLDIPDSLTTSTLISDLRRSDHASFWDASLPAMMLTDTADFRNPGYHCELANDTVDSLNLDFAVKVVRATAGAAFDLLTE